MNLIIGKKYNILDENAYYTGKCDSFCGQKCDCCGRELESGYLFYVPVLETTTYEETKNGKFKDQIKIGNTCIKKLKIEEVI